MGWRGCEARFPARTETGPAHDRCGRGAPRGASSDVVSATKRVTGGEDWTSEPPVVLGVCATQTERRRHRLLDDRRQEMGGESAIAGAGTTGLLQPLRGGEPAAGRRRRPARPWRSLAAGAGPGSRRWRARNDGGGRPTLPLPALRRDHDGTARRAVRSASLLGIGDWPGALPVRARGALHRRDPRARVHVAGGLRPEPMDHTAQLGGSGRSGSALASNRRVAALALSQFVATEGRARRSVSVRLGAGRLGATRRASVRRGRARCLRGRGSTQARSPPPPSRVVSSRGRRTASHSPRGPAHLLSGAARGVNADERSQPPKSR
jgi:hypothetical protein